MRKFPLLQTLVRRELEARYRGSFFGRSWPLVTQIAQLLVFTYLFAAVLKVRLHLPGANDTPAAYGLWLFAALTPWTAFSIAVSQGSQSIMAQSSLVKRVVFPLAVLPLVPVIAAFVESLAGVAVLIVLFAITTQQVHPTLLLLPLIWLPQLALTAGITYFVAALTVFVRDVPQALGPILLVVFYLTPIVYPSEIVPAAMHGLTVLNPLTFVVSGTRDLIIYGQLPPLWSFATFFVESGVFFAVGLAAFRVLRPAFADVL